MNENDCFDRDSQSLTDPGRRVKTGCFQSNLFFEINIYNWSEGLMNEQEKR